MSYDPGRDELSNRLQQAYMVYQAAASKGCIPYLQSILIDCRPEPALFRDRADSWQWEIVKRIAPAIESVAGVRQDYEGPTSFWLTLPRGHDKTSLIGRLLNWALAFSRLQIDAIASAADKEQAGFVTNKMQSEARLNPWLEQLLYFKHHQVKGPRGSTLKVISADAKSNYGLSPDLILCDELTQWGKQDNWDSLVTAKRKRGKKAVHIVITNAGIKYTWQWEVMQEARSDESWWVYEAPGPICSWMDLEAMERDRKTMLPAIARQMIDNEWLDPGESSGFVTRSEAYLCEDPSLPERMFGLPDNQYIGVIDYAPVKDRTVMGVMHQEPGLESFVLDRMDIFQGSKKDRVAIRKVEEWIDQQWKNFNLAYLVVDPYQMESTIQRYGARLPVERFEPRGGKANYELAQALRSAIINKKIRWPAGCGVLRDNKLRPHTIADELAELIVKQMAYGYRIDHLPNKHDDRSVVLGMGLVALLKRPLKRNLWGTESDLWF